MTHKLVAGEVFSSCCCFWWQQRQECLQKPGCFESCLFVRRSFLRYESVRYDVFFGEKIAGVGGNNGSGSVPRSFDVPRGASLSAD
mmetsp:Transcript_135151/g.269656  ORF Transcript_135151/g.269656 Transcript_135151/m.269656 type:complete len:86 (+) Transcript_135151:1709-1966(+)